MIIINIGKVAQAFYDYMETRKPIITVRKFTVGVGVAAAVGVITGNLIARRAEKKRREEQRGNSGKTTVTIDVHDLENIRIERTE